MGDKDLVTEQGVDEGTQDAMTESPREEGPDPAGPMGALPDEPPAAPTGPEKTPPRGPGQQLEEGEG